jgi:hypothetical protein
MDFHQPIGNFEFGFVFVALLLHPLPFLFINRLITTEHFSITEYSSPYLVVLLITFFKALGFSVKNAALNREESALSVVFEAVSFAF